jgi:5-(carboxyamino)imidazole ribonucleotide synthase
MKLDRKILGILGGGQLGRMSALAAARLGIKTHIYTDEENSPASQVAAQTFVGAYDDKRKLKAFAETVDVITYEFENIPVETVRTLQTLKPVYPDDRLLEIAQHRVREKQFLNDIGIGTAGWAAIARAGDIAKAAERLGGTRFILKTARFGYDGKGQTDYQPGDDVKRKWKDLGEQELILEARLDFACEVSVIIARDKLGQTAKYGPILNEHKNGILARSTAPAPIPEPMAVKAQDMARLLADAVDLVGVLALELFITKDGQILANEIAPRTHNSGHWTIDACAVSQFEQHVRTVTGMPVASPVQHSNAVMHNLIGMDASPKKLNPWMEKKGACVHLYGKDEIREGRKMGHVTVLKL